MESHKYRRRNKAGKEGFGRRKPERREGDKNWVVASLVLVDGRSFPTKKIVRVKRGPQTLLSVLLRALF